MLTSLTLEYKIKYVRQHVLDKSSSDTDMLDRNVAPHVIRRFAKQDHVYIVEEVLLDKTNKILYARVQNRSFANYGTLRSFSKYEVHPDIPHATILYQHGEARLSSSLGMARGMVRRFVLFIAGYDSFLNFNAWMK